jgi:glycosyltransferase involved in cell wall biosynthesis
MLMNYYRQMDRTRVQFDFLTHREYDGDYGEEIRQLGGKLYHMPVLNPFSPAYRKQLGEFFDSHSEYKIVHVHQDCLSGVILHVAKEHGVPVRIAHSHGANQIKDIKYPIKLFYRHFIAKYATKLMACGEDAGKWMFCGAPFEILSNAIPVASYSFNEEVKKVQREQWNIQPYELLVGHVGSFTVPKNHLFLLDIFNEIQKRTPAKLMLVGDQCHRNDIEEKIRNLRLQDKVILTGVRSDIPDLLQAMDVFVFPSLYEGLPVTLVEAQASGLPCLISDKVPIECKMTEAMQQIPLTASPEIWAEKVIEAAKTPRKNTYEEIKAAGYDIVENAKRLQKMYEEMMISHG